MILYIPAMQTLTLSLKQQPISLKVLKTQGNLNEKIECIVYPFKKLFDIILQNSENVIAKGGVEHQKASEKNNARQTMGHRHAGKLAFRHGRGRAAFGAG